VLARGLALRGGDGLAHRMVGSIGDITELKRRETDLRASEARFRSLVRTAGSIILVLDADGVVIEANREAERALALEPGGAVGRLWRDVIVEQQGGPFAFQLVAAMSGMEIRNFEHTWNDRSGAERVVLWNMNRLPDAEGGPASIVCVGQDITRRKRAELALREGNDALEARVAARTAELIQEVQERRRAEEALLSAKEQAELANRAKSEFLANMSHELRTPLNAVIGFASMIQGEMVGPLGTPRYGEYAGLIVTSGEHLLAVINDILDIAKIEAGKFEIHPQPVDVRDAVGSSVQLIRGRAAEGGVGLTVDVSADTPLLLADPVRLKQILLNLLSNAVKFTPAGGRVGLRVRRDDAHGLIEVTDTGIGMSAQDIAVALQPFGQVDSHLARRHGGTGLGLPLARSFVDLHGGTLSIDSAEGQGTTVRVRLPAAE
jgi:two-component system cell cycle sensor histidine kinase PleC